MKSHIGSSDKEGKADWDYYQANHTDSVHQEMETSFVLKKFYTNVQKKSSFESMGPIG